MTAPTLERVVRVIALAAELPEDETLTEDTALMEAGLALDSVAIVELLVGLEKEFQIEIDMPELLREQAFRTVGTLVAFVERKLDSER